MYQHKNNSLFFMPKRCKSILDHVTKASLVHNFSLYVYFFSLHVSGDYVLIIRRNNCIYATLGTCYSVWLTVWNAGAYAPAYQTVIHTMWLDGNWSVPIQSHPRQDAVMDLLMPDAVDTVKWAPDVGWRYHLKHVEWYRDINKLYVVVSCWTTIGIYFMMHGPLNVKC